MTTSEYNISKTIKRLEERIYHFELMVRLGHWSLETVESSINQAKNLLNELRLQQL